MKLIISVSLRRNLHVVVTCVAASLHVASMPVYANDESQPSNSSPSKATISVLVGTQVSGDIKEVFFSVGDKVSRGAVLATIKPSGRNPTRHLNPEGLYEVISPFDATVIHCFVVPGQTVVAGLETKLFELAGQREH